MEERYSRNRLYMSEREQNMVKDYKIFLGAAGIGSIVAECALRFGFEHITIVDGDKVDRSNLNRENYTENDIGRYKAECLAERLLSINPDAHIRFYTEFLAPGNIEKMLNGMMWPSTPWLLRTILLSSSMRSARTGTSPYFIPTTSAGRGLLRLWIRWGIPYRNWQKSLGGLN